ncbi:MAG: glycosyltransferase family 4 protein [Campylobacterales bacterium]|nr:glycosyltransferase family 4 protein [Campylobacterales bacterium]
MIHEIKERWVQLCGILESGLPREAFEQLLQQQLGFFYEHHAIMRSADKALFSWTLYALRAQIVNFVHQGDLIDNNYINLFFLFRGVDLQPDPRIDKLLPILLDAYHGYHEAQKEKYLFAHLIFILRFINGDGEEGLMFFLSEHLFFDGKAYSTMDRDAKQLGDFLGAHEIGFDTVAPAIERALNISAYTVRSEHQRHTLFVWVLGFFWKLSGYENHLLWKEKIYPKLLELFRVYLGDVQHIETVMHLHFLMSHLYLNASQTQEEFEDFNRDVEIPASKYYAAWGTINLPVLQNMPSRSRKRVALLKDRIVLNAPFKVEASLVWALSEFEVFPAQYELQVYSMAMVEKSLDDAVCIKEFERHGAVVIESAFVSLNLQSSYQSHLGRALAIRHAMQENGIGLLIIASNNMPIGNFLLSTRSVAQQYFWSHGNFVYDVEGIDKRITHIRNLNYPYPYEVFDVPMRITSYYTPQVDPKKIAAERSRYPQNVTILGTIGRLIKVDHQGYLEAVARIMEKFPNTIYIAAGSGETQGILKKVRELGFESRFFMPGFVDPHVYGAIIEVWLNTFPASGGEALQEYMAKGGIFVQKTEDTDYLEHARASLETDTKVNVFFKRYGYCEADKLCKGEPLGVHRYAATDEEYVQRVSDFLSDTQLCEAYRNLNRQQMEFFNSEMHLSGFIDLLGE